MAKALQGCKGLGKEGGLLCPQHPSEPRAGKGPLHQLCASVLQLCLLSLLLGAASQLLLWALWLGFQLIHSLDSSLLSRAFKALL